MLRSGPRPPGESWGVTAFTQPPGHLDAQPMGVDGIPLPDDCVVGEGEMSTKELIARRA